MGQISIPGKEPIKITVGKIAPMGSFVAELYYSISNEDNSDTTYTLMYRDDKYNSLLSLESVSFSGMDNALEQLYIAMKSVFLPDNKNKKEYALNFKLGKDVVQISNFKSFGVYMVLFMADNKGYFKITQSQLDKLFGKK